MAHRGKERHTFWQFGRLPNPSHAAGETIRWEFMCTICGVGSFLRTPSSFWPRSLTRNVLKILNINFECRGNGSIKLEFLRFIGQNFKSEKCKFKRPSSILSLKNGIFPLIFIERIFVTFFDSK
jgi:hypothetical protein